MRRLVRMTVWNYICTNGTNINKNKLYGPYPDRTNKVDRHTDRTHTGPDPTNAPDRNDPNRNQPIERKQTLCLTSTPNKTNPRKHHPRHEATWFGTIPSTQYRSEHPPIHTRTTIANPLRKSHCQPRPQQTYQNHKHKIPITTNRRGRQNKEEF